MRLTEQRIFLVSNEAWGPVWFSKHHFAAELSKNNDVLFVNPPTAWRPRRNARPRLETITGLPRLSVLHYDNVLPFSGRSRVLFEANERLVTRRINRFLPRRLSPTLFWSFDPHRLVTPNLLGVSGSIYQMMDYYNVRWEADLVANADLVLAVSPTIAARRAWAKRVATVPQAVAEAPFPRSLILSAPGEREAVLVGTLTSRIDYDLLLGLAQADVQCRVRLVGPLDESGLDARDRALVRELRALPSVDFAGVRDQRALPHEILRARVGLCCYKRSHPGNLVDSHKVLQYLSLGKPVVTTPLEAYRHAPSGLVRIVETRAEFTRACREELDKPVAIEARARRLDFAQQFSYPRVLSQIEDLLQSALGSPAHS